MSTATGRRAIGIDVGGTSMRVGLVSDSGQCLSTHRDATPVDATGDVLVANIGEMVERFQQDAESSVEKPRLIGLAVPGSFDSDRRIIVRSVNLPESEGAAIGELLAERLGGAAVTLMNDAHAATWGEYHAQADGGSPCFVHLRLGTGVACGVVKDAKLLRLDAGRDTHFEVLVVEDGPDAPVCLCGLRGCLEAIASGAALAVRAKALGLSGGLAGLQAACERGETSALDTVRDAATAVTVVIGRLTERFNPGVICVGGGVCKYLPVLVDVFTQRLEEDAAGRSVPKVISPQLGDDAGVVGAALIALRPDCLPA